MEKRVTASSTADGLTLHISHKLADAANAEQIAECVDQLLQCAENNGCLSGEVKISNSCLETIAKHNAESNCISSCFGC